MIVDDDGRAIRGPQPCHLGQTGIGHHTDGQHHEVSGQNAVGGEHRIVGEALRGRLQQNAHPVALHLCSHLLGHLMVERPHDLIGGLEQGHIPLPVTQCLDHLHTDVAAAHDHRPTGAGVHHGLDPVHVGQVAQGVDQWAVHTGDGRFQRGRTSGQNEFVVRLRVGRVRVDIADRDRVSARVDRDHFIAHPHVQCQVLRQALRGLDQQC